MSVSGIKVGIDLNHCISNHFPGDEFERDRDAFFNTLGIWSIARVVAVSERGPNQILWAEAFDTDP